MSAPVGRFFVSVAANVALAATLTACGVGPHTRAAGVVGQVSVRPVEWNPAAAELGDVRAVADTGDVVAVFADDRATVFSSRAVVAVDRAVKGWVDADTIYGADGSAQWIVGIDGKGRVYYLHGRSSFEDVSERYGLGSKAVRTAAVLGPGFVGFLEGGEVALADGRQVTRYGVTCPERTAPAGCLPSELVGGGGFGAWIVPSGLELLNAGAKTVTSFALRDAKRAALAPNGRLYAMTPRALYAADARGQLALIYEADGASLHGLVASGEHVWFADGTELGVIDGDKVAETTGARVAQDARLAASPSGDVWVMAGTSLKRFARTDPEPALGAVWNQSLAAVFARACSACHLPNGESGTDLSTAEGWQSERAMIRDRVLVRRTMPPQGHALAEADRVAIAVWAAAQP